MSLLFMNNYFRGAFVRFIRIEKFFGNFLSGYIFKFLKDTNIKKEFKRVDLDLVIKICKKASQAGISNVLIISAVGANSSSLNYYLKIKGMMEDEVKSIGFNTIFFARPGHLLGLSLIHI